MCVFFLREVLLASDSREAPGVSASGPDPSVLEGPARQPGQCGRCVWAARGPQDRLLQRYHVSRSLGITRTSCPWKAWPSMSFWSRMTAVVAPQGPAPCYNSRIEMTLQVTLSELSSHVDKAANNLFKTDLGVHSFYFSICVCAYLVNFILISPPFTKCTQYFPQTLRLNLLPCWNSLDIVYKWTH